MINRKFLAVIVSVLLLACQPVSAKQDKTVIGPSNADLADGAKELLAGNAEKGVRLSLQGMKYALSKDDKLAGLSNLCAGYFMLNDIDEALTFCNRALELDDSHWRALSNRALIYVELKRYDEAELDLQKGLEIAPGSRTLNIISGMLLDATNPVAPSIIIDDSREGNYDNNE
jgi:tetratricopeptide (TPR) repeat protein